MKQALRALRKSPGFAFSALAILTLGIGANTAIFGIVNAVLLKPLPFPHSEAIVTVFHVPPQKAFPGMTMFAVSPANYLDWKKQNTVFETTAIVGFRGFPLGGGSRPESVLTAITEPGFFTLLGVPPEAGRTFTTEECQPGRDKVVVVSHAFAETHFGTPANAVGKTLELKGANYRVIGVMPQSFQVKSWFPASGDAWAPLAWTAKEAAVRGNHNYMVVARLRDGITVKQAQIEMNLISDRLAREYPEEDSGWGAVVLRLRDYLVGDVRPALLTLLGAVGFVLLIACANTANLVLARTISRRKELAIRAALGASANQVLRPVLVETTLLSIAGGALGLLLARSGQSIVFNALADQMPHATEVRVDGMVLGFTLAVSLLTGLAAGLIAGWRLTRVDLNEALKQGFGKTDSGSGGKRTRTALVISEVALSLILLVGAGLMIRTLWALRHVDPGFVPANVITMEVPIPKASADQSHRSRFYDEFLPKVRRLPGLVDVAAIDILPLDRGGSQQPVAIAGRPAEIFALQPTVAVRKATPGYLRTMGVALVAGRDFNEEDTLENKPAVLISQSMARQFWPGENPLGKRLTLSFSAERVREVVGVVGDVKERGLNVLEPVPMLYEPLRQSDTGAVSLVVRGSRNASALAPSVARILREIDPNLPVREVKPMDEIVAASLSRQRFSMVLFVALAVLAFVLAAVGIYSVLAYTVRSRVQEIGVRMAMGAGVPDVLRLIVLEGMKPALGGIAAGAFGAWLLSSALAQLVYGVSTTDPYTFAAVALLLTGVAFLACLIPAYRATRVEPVMALRNE